MVLLASSPIGSTQIQDHKLTLDLILGGEFSEVSGEVGEWLPSGREMIATAPSNGPLGGEEIVRIDAATGAKTVIAPSSRLVPAGAKQPLRIEGFTLSKDQKNLLIFTNSSRVWRQNTRGDYWTLNLDTWKLMKLGGMASPSSLMFANFSPDGRQVGYVYKNDLYCQQLGTGAITRLTNDGGEKIVNGTSDWVYEEELDLRDAWRWSPDGKSIAYWHFDTSKEPLYTLINTTDSLYPTLKQFPYPKAGQTNADVKIGVVPSNGGATKWMSAVATSKSGYLARMDWVPNSHNLLIQRLDRLQQTNDFIECDATTGISKSIFRDSDAAWVEIGMNDTSPSGVKWVDDGKEFLTLSERDGWRHLYEVSMTDGHATLLTPGPFDVDKLLGIDERQNLAYFSASPTNATQRYLFKANLQRGASDSQNAARLARVTPEAESGSNEYLISPDGTTAVHIHSSLIDPPTTEIVALPSHSTVRMVENNHELRAKLSSVARGKAEFRQLKTADGQEMDAMLILPPNFDPNKNYPLFFHVYGEPWDAIVRDQWQGQDYLINEMLAQMGYIVACVDNRGTPTLKGRDWRKSVYKKIGVVASQDQAAAATQLSELSYIDKNRIAIWGWSGGGSMTLNMMFRYPKIYKLGMAVAPVPDVHLYDSIYQERYMGLPQDNESFYEQSSPITFAQQLEGPLLIVHGSGDDNVHYQGTERLVNKLVEFNKPFQLMVYPNRSHGIYEGPGTTRHLWELLIRFLTTNMAP